MNTQSAAIKPLGLDSILVSSLPPTLLTDAAPDRYIVDAVFTRRVEPEEAALILGRNTQDTLATRGYPNIKLSISDRRLVIANTNLEELRDGLAQEIVALLATISAQVRTQHQQKEARRELEVLHLQERAQAITELISSINLDPVDASATLSNQDNRRATDRWDSEGGALLD